MMEIELEVNEVMILIFCFRYDAEAINVVRAMPMYV